MNITLSTAKRAYKLFSHEGVAKATIRHNVAQWCRSMSLLGEHHILAKQIQRKAH